MDAVLDQGDMMELFMKEPVRHYWYILQFSAWRRILHLGIFDVECLKEVAGWMC